MFHFSGGKGGALELRGKGEGVRVIYLKLAYLHICVCVWGRGGERKSHFIFVNKKNRFLKNILSCGVVFSRLRIPWKTCVLNPISSS